jgi:acyl carrier protein phosphodiesterase
VLDVAFDHFLAKNWTDYAVENLPDFAGFAYRALLAHAHRFPVDFQPFLPRMIADDFWRRIEISIASNCALQKCPCACAAGENMREGVR